MLQADVEAATTEPACSNSEPHVPDRRPPVSTRCCAQSRLSCCPHRSNDLRERVAIAGADLLRADGRDSAARSGGDCCPRAGRAGGRRTGDEAIIPDTEIYGRYDSFWQPAATQGPLRGQVGVNMNVPIYRRKLNAAVSEAQFKLAQRQAEYRQKVADMQFEVESARTGSPRASKRSKSIGQS